jgi:hypothetical protein
MLPNSPIQVISAAYIEGVVTALNDIDKLEHIIKLQCHL